MSSQNTHTMLENAVANHKQGRLQAAEALYRQILSQAPDHCDANHNLGLLAVQVNKADSALPFFKKALEAKASIRQYWISYIDALIKTNNYEPAAQVLAKGKQSGLSGTDIDHFEKLIHSNQNIGADPKSIYSQAVAAFQKNDFQTAVKHFSKVIEIIPDSAEAFNGLGLALKGLEQPDQALKSFERALSFKPDFAEAYNNKGNVLNKLEMFEKALECFDRATKLNPGNALFFTNKGNTFKNLGQLQKALKCFDKALKLKSDYSQALQNRASILIELSRYEQALKDYDKAVMLNPDVVEALNDRGTALHLAGRSEEALKDFNKAIKLSPDFALSYKNRGITFKSLGKFELALQDLNKAIELEPDLACAYASLTALKKYKADDPQIKAMESIAQNTNIDDSDKIFLYFSLAKAYEDFDSYDQSFDYLQKANHLHKKNENYSMDIFKKRISFIKDIFEPEYQPPAIKPSRPIVRPVFIVGMPRSGTSLVEQILASHTAVYGAGELTAMPGSIDLLLNKKYKREETGKNRTRLLSGEIHKIRNDYLKALALLKADEKYITDKMPDNHKNIGFILVAFPEARIINLQRDPRAVCFSIYKHHFRKGSLPWAYDMQDIAQNYKLYLDIMSFWRKRFPGVIYDLSYEALTECQESESRKLIEFCGLDWEAKCLDFHKTKRAVNTASVSQVRNKMYKGSSQAWLKYENHLQQLWEAYGIAP